MAVLGNANLGIHRICSIHVMLNMLIFNIGSATTFIPTFDLTGLCFHLGTVLFTAYFPFRARKLETRGGYKYLHLVAIVCAVGFSVFLVGLQFAVGGYSRTVVPIFCLAASESAFVFGVIPACLISAIFLTFVMALFFKIIDMQGWKSKPSQVTTQYIIGIVPPLTHTQFPPLQTYTH